LRRKLDSSSRKRGYALFSLSPPEKKKEKAPLLSEKTNLEKDDSRGSGGAQRRRGGENSLSLWSVIERREETVPEERSCKRSGSAVQPLEKGKEGKKRKDAFHAFGRKVSAAQIGECREGGEGKDTVTSGWMEGKDWKKARPGAEEGIEEEPHPSLDRGE